MTARTGPVTLHEEIADVLREHRNAWMTTGQLADEVNGRGRYRKRDGSRVSAFQIHGRTRNYPSLFERDDSRVRLRQEGIGSVRQPAFASVATGRLFGTVPNVSPGHTIELASVLAELGPPGIHIADLPAPARPGLYAVHASAAVWQDLGLGVPPDGRPLYVGKSESSLLSRDLGQHFHDGTTGSSTLRRSLAALLNDSLDLRGVPRNLIKPGYYSNYGLSPEDDAKLSTWMRERLRLSVMPVTRPADLRTIEDRVIRKLRPPLNLYGVSTPWKAMVSRKRRAMAEQARDWRP